MRSTDRLPVPRFEEPPSEPDPENGEPVEPEAAVDAPLIRAISILSHPQTYQKMIADLDSDDEISQNVAPTGSEARDPGP